MTNRTPAVVAVLMLLTGCTFSDPPPTSPAITSAPETPTSATPASATPTPATSTAAVHVKLVIDSDQPSTLRYSNGLDTSTIMADPNQVIHFEAPTPWAVAVTAVTTTGGLLSCRIYVDDKLVSSFDGLAKFAFCGAAEENVGADDPLPGTHQVSMKATAPGGARVGWTSTHSGGTERVDPGTNSTIATNQTDGDARMVIISEVKNDGATCEIMIDGFRMARDETDGTIGDIATCHATAEHPAVDDRLPEPTES